MKRCLLPNLRRPQAQEARKEAKEVTKDVRKVRAKEKVPKDDATAVVAHTTRQTAH